MSTQRAFGKGEIAPSLYARTDLTAYQTGLRTLRNMFIGRSGGAYNRAGTEYIAETKNSGAVKFGKFVFNDEQTYVLEFGNLYVRFYRDGVALTTIPVAASDPDWAAYAWDGSLAYTVGQAVHHLGAYYVARVAHTAHIPTAGDSNTWWALITGYYEIPTPYTTADLPLLQYVQSADVITITHPNHRPHELTRYAERRWWLSEVELGASIGASTGVNLSGTAGAVTTHYAVTAIDPVTGEEGLPATASTAVLTAPAAGTPITVTVEPVVGAVEYNVYRSTDGLSYGLVGILGGTPVTVTDTTFTTTGATASTATQAVWFQSVAQVRNPVGVSVSIRAYDQRYLVHVKMILETSGAGSGIMMGNRVRAFYSRNGETRVDAGIVYNRALSSWLPVQSLSVSMPVAVIVPDNGYTTLTIDLVPEVYGTSVTGTPTFKTILDVTTAPYDYVSFQKTAYQFVDDGSDADTTIRPPVARDPFVGTGNYPRAVTYYQQRLSFAGSDLAPETVWASQTGAYKNFTTSTPLQDDDAVTFTLAGKQVNQVRHLLDLNRLLAFCSGSIYVVEGDEAGILRPGEINARVISSTGVAEYPSPLVVDNVVMFMQARGNIVRSLNDNTGADMTVFASHLFNGFEIIAWDYQQNPDSVLYAVRSDGVLLGLTYMPDQEMWGWHHHDTQGTFEDVVVVPEGAEDVVYVVANRTINGLTKRYVERFASRAFEDIEDAFFVDSGLSYNGTNRNAAHTMTLSTAGGWTVNDLITITSSAAFFSAGEVGNAVDFTDADGVKLRLTLNSYTSPTVMKGYPSRDIPVSLRTATAVWSRAADTFTGLSHLEGEEVAVYGDGYVAASPNNSEYTAVTVTGGSVTLDQPYSRVAIGLPYISDLQTLDLDSSGRSVKTRKMAVNKVILYVESSRGIFAGREEPEGDDPLEGLYEYKGREFDDPDAPPELTTEDIEILMTTGWDRHGRVFVRQVDPLPLGILSATPVGFLPFR